MEWIWLAVAGIAAGFVSGLMGVGGGIVMTPVLHYLAGYDWPDAVALSLLVIAIQSPLGIAKHQQRGSVDLRMALPLVVGGAGGVVIGAWAEPRIAVPALKITFAALMAFAAWRLSQGGANGAARLTATHLLIIGVGAGVVSRLLGVGGGILTVPVLALFGVPAQIAVGTSLVPVFTNAAVASFWNMGGGLDPVPGIPLAIGALLAAPWGVRAAHALPEKQLRRVVAGALVVTGAVIAFEALS